VTTRSIAKRAGIAHGDLCAHFRSKNAIITVRASCGAGTFRQTADELASVVAAVLPDGA
jgi:AcrR family transcriptional regulator